MLKSANMQDAVRNRLLLFISTLIVVPVLTVVAILFARGYRPSLTHKGILITGILAANSYPDGAQVYVNGQLKTATNASLSLAPGIYRIEIKKEGYQSWTKDMVIDPEIVTRATAVLFPSVPVLKPITTDGAVHPLLSPDGTKTAFYTPGQRQLFLLDLSESPLGLLSRDSRLVTTFLSPITQSLWSPDSRQILVTATSSAYLVDTGSGQISVVVSSEISKLWAISQSKRQNSLWDSLPKPLADLLATSAADLVWSPQENKILYTATSAANLSDNIIRPLPGSSTQPQSRNLIPNQVYIYDLEEDRNFLIDKIAISSPTPKSKKGSLSTLPLALGTNANWQWFPTSSHIFRVENNQIVIKEYDNQNRTVIYTGPLAEPLAIPYPSKKQILILTRLDSASSSANLYAISLK